MQIPQFRRVKAVSKPLNCGDLLTCCRNSQGETGIYAASVNQDGAGTTLPVIAPLLAARQIEMLSQGVQERSTTVKSQRL
jgi:hypothetical protein